MRVLIALFAIAVSEVALADGVDLTYLPAPLLTSSEQQSLSKISARSDAASFVVTGMNAAALDSTIVNITVNNVVYRLVGAKTNRTDLPNVDLWSGSYAGMTADFARLNGNVRGRVYVGDDVYEVVQIGPWVGATVQIKPKALGDTPRPQQ